MLSIHKYLISLFDEHNPPENNIKLFFWRIGFGLFFIYWFLGCGFIFVMVYWSIFSPLYKNNEKLYKFWEDFCIDDSWD